MSASGEDILQMQVMRWIAVAAPDLVIWHIPNGGYRAAREAKKLKDMGVRPGVADLACILPNGQTGYIEMKVEGSYQRPVQKAFQADCERWGAPYAVCRSIEDVEETLRQWNVPLRVQKAA